MCITSIQNTFWYTHSNIYTTYYSPVSNMRFCFIHVYIHTHTHTHTRTRMIWRQEWLSKKNLKWYVLASRMRFAREFYGLGWDFFFESQITGQFTAHNDYRADFWEIYKLRGVKNEIRAISMYSCGRVFVCICTTRILICWYDTRYSPVSEKSFFLMYVYIYTHTHTHMHTYTCIIHQCQQWDSVSCMYTYAHSHTHAHTHTRTRTIHRGKHILAPDFYAFVCVCVCLDMYVYVL